MGTEFQFGKMQQFWKYMYLIPLTGHVEVVKVVPFMLRIFYGNNPTTGHRTLGW